MLKLIKNPLHFAFWITLANREIKKAHKAIDNKEGEHKHKYHYHKSLYYYERAMKHEYRGYFHTKD